MHQLCRTGLQAAEIEHKLIEPYGKREIPYQYSSSGAIMLSVVMSPDRRAELANRFVKRDPVILAATQLRKTEEELIKLYHAESITDLSIPSLVFYQSWHVTPRIDAIDTYMCNLRDWFNLQLGDRSDGEIIDQIDSYDPERYRLDLRRGQTRPRVGEPVVITRSSIYELQGKQLLPIFEATVRPLGK